MYPSEVYSRRRTRRKSSSSWVSGAYEEREDQVESFLHLAVSQVAEVEGGELVAAEVFDELAPAGCRHRVEVAVVAGRGHRSAEVLIRGRIINISYISSRDAGVRPDPALDVQTRLT